MFYGCGSDSIGGAGPQHNGDWLVQALPNLIHGGSKNGATDSALLPDVFGEHYWSMLRATMRPGCMSQPVSVCCVKSLELGWRLKFRSRLLALHVLLVKIRRIYCASFLSMKSFSIECIENKITKSASVCVRVRGQSI